MKQMEPDPQKQKKRLRWILLLLFIGPSVPVYYLLQTVYTQLENEAYFNVRHQAETLVDQIELKLQYLLEKEQSRPIAEYKFFNVMENQLLSETSAVKFSPLSEIPPKTDIKGLIGYFQINTDGSFHLPALPEIGQDNLSGLSLAELDSRLKLKKELRNLLSTKITEKRRIKTQTLDEPLEANKARLAVENQSYIEAFKQDTNMADDLESPVLFKQSSIKSKKENRDYLGKTYPLAKDKWQQKNKKTAKKYKTRKELVQIPDQSMASRYFNQSKEYQKPVLSEQESFVVSKKDDTLKRQKVSESAINVFSFESEVTPLQLFILGQKYFCFYRYVWHDNNRYTQGFIVESDEFLTMITQALANSTGFSSFLFSSNGRLLQKIGISSSSEEYQLYSRNLSMPFQKLTLVVNAPQLSEVPGSLLIDLLGLSIYCIFFIGFIAIYHLASRQIDLAKQQQNFISAVSHELKTPLTSIRMYGEMLRSGWVIDENKKKAYYDFIFFESERLSRLIANVLHLARLGHQTHHSSEIITINAHALFNQISPRVEAQIEASSFYLNIKQPAKKIQEIEVSIDLDAFFQMVINLVDNAIKFSSHSEKKQIDIGFFMSKNEGYISLSIRDYGPGIKKHQMKRIFQLFYRSGDELTRTTPGTGIGLALVAQLAKTMGASVEVINKQPGAEFKIKLPIILK